MIVGEKSLGNEPGIEVVPRKQALFVLRMNEGFFVSNGTWRTIMSIPKRYNPRTAEPALQETWTKNGVYDFDPHAAAPRFSIDTPPATVSGNLHLGHVFSYSHTDFIARFRRMRGENVFYPMGFDDNGLPTERLVEKREGVRPQEIGREAFVALCEQTSAGAEAAYRALWQRLGLSIDWRYSYRTINSSVQRLAQWSFRDLYTKGLVYREDAPAIWCPECQTAIAQAEVRDLERESTFYTLQFRLPDGSPLPIATTRPELLPACVAVFVNPEDDRYTAYLGQPIPIPLFGREVPLLADEAADPAKGSGAVMCCTFGDVTDVAWWRQFDLPLIDVLGKDGRLTTAAGPYADLTIAAARAAILADLAAAGDLSGAAPIAQTIRAHERCDTPLETIICPQWFVRVLDFKNEFLAAGAQIVWHPAHMAARYAQWVENLSWDWGISRQRFYGVPMPVWYCNGCGSPIVAAEAELPVNPLRGRPSSPCPTCDGMEFTPETDVFDTWFTSSLTPQIAGQFQTNDELYRQTFPFAMRPQAHEIIRTWAFYTIVKSWHHFQTVPFRHVAISGWGLAPAGTEKLSKSRGGGVTSPQEMIDRYSADAVRYWAASTAIGRDAIIDEEKIQAGQKLVTKLWNVARFSRGFLEAPIPAALPANATLADRWLLAQAAELIERATTQFANFDYAAAKNETEQFFWRVLADNYLEMAKMRLYAGDQAATGARYALYHGLLTALKLFAPILPHVTERIFQGLYAERESTPTIHRASWPAAADEWRDEAAWRGGEALVEIATAVRRYKSRHALSLGAELGGLQIAAAESELARQLPAGELDLRSITRAAKIVFTADLTGAETVQIAPNLTIRMAAAE
jgi:valyl-tRNA synthetase